MRSVKIKTTCGCNGNTLAVGIASADLALGDSEDRSLQVREVKNIPNSVTDKEVFELYQHTVDLTWLNHQPARMCFEFSELGIGKIIRE